MCAAKESRRVWKALNLWRRLQFMKRSPTDTLLHCSSSRWLILVMLHRNCVCFAFRAAAFGVGDLNIGSTTANAINFDFRRLVNIDDDHWDCARLSVTGLVGFGVCALHLRVDKSCVCAPFWLAVGGLAGARREAQVGHRMISPTMYLHGPFMARFTSPFVESMFDLASSTLKVSFGRNDFRAVQGLWKAEWISVLRTLKKGTVLLWRH